MENENIQIIKRKCEEITIMAAHSKSMSVGAKLLIENRIKTILEKLEIIELELMARK